MHVYSILVISYCIILGTFNDADVSDLIKESVLMKEFNHPNVMRLLGVCVNAGPAPYIVLPYMINGDLLSYLKNNRDTLLLETKANTDEVHMTLIKI